MALVLTGASLKAERIAAHASQEEVARAMGVSVKTVQRVEHAESVNARMATAYRSAIRQATGRPSNGKSPDFVVPRGTVPGVVREPSAPYDIPRRLEIMALDFEKEALEAEADEHFMRYARGRLRDHTLFEMYAGGHSSRPLTVAEQIDDYAEVIEDLRRILNKRKKRFDDESGRVE